MSATRTVLILFHVLLSTAWTQGREALGGDGQDWGYITVRPNAHMFWWLYYTTYNNISNYTDRPLIIWLQGGPGMPSSGYGNFVEIGPFDVDFVKREQSFVDNFNVLFIDNPVGVGYSYFSGTETPFVTSGEEIGEDLYNFLKVFMTERHPEFKTVPVYVFGESYGGKMATEFVHNLIQKEKKGGQKLCNLKGLALGDAYISPSDYVNQYAPLALNLGLVNKQIFTEIDNLAKQSQVLINKKEFKKATDLKEEISSVLQLKTFGFDMNNFLATSNSTKTSKFWDYQDALEEIMNNEVKDALNITAEVMWAFVEHELHASLEEDLHLGVTHKVEDILNSTDIKVIVYNGMLDFLVNTAGTIAWLDGLGWKGRENWYNARQFPLIINKVSEGYYKRVDNLVFYAILRAGHSVPVDNLPVMNVILQKELLD